MSTFKVGDFVLLVPEAIQTSDLPWMNGDRPEQKIMPNIIYTVKQVDNGMHLRLEHPHNNYWLPTDCFSKAIIPLNSKEIIKIDDLINSIHL